MSSEGSVTRWLTSLQAGDSTGAFSTLRRDKDRFVVKRVDEDGGGGVWIGHKESKSSLVRLIERIREEPGRYIVQDFEHLSVLDNRTSGAKDLPPRSWW